jgi:endo-1,4-beta-xylanase
MKPLSLFASVALSCLAFSASHAADVNLGEPKAKPVSWNNADTAPKGLIHDTVRSAGMNLEIGHNVYLPPGYEQGDTRYPVIYFLHGWGGNENSDAGTFDGWLAKLTREHNLPRAICVFPNGGRSWYQDYSVERGLIETHLTRELIPYIDRTYRTLADREHRVLVGFSMGGGGAVRLAVKYPELFSAAGAWGGAFSFRDPNPIPDELKPAGLAKVAGRVRLYLTVGTEDSQLLTHPAMIQNLADAKFPFTYEVLAGVPHDPSEYYKYSGEQMLRFLTAGF